MTVDELLDRIIGLPGVTPEAMKTYAPVFRARFERRGGEHLRVAFEQTMATFKPTRNQPFPIPADIEAHMPSLGRPSGEGGVPIRDKLQRQHARAKILLTDWEAGQGAKIKRSRSPELYAACWLEAFDQALRKALDERVTGIVLDQPAVNLCYQRAISAERNRRHGPPDRYNAEQWRSQVREIGREWGLEVTPDWWPESTTTPGMRIARYAGLRPYRTNRALQ